MGHALLSASGASIWIKCTMNPRFAEGRPDTAGIEAQRGTLAHHIAEWTLRGLLGMNTMKFVQQKLKVFKANEMYDAEMSRIVRDFVTYVMEEYSKALSVDPKAQIFLERQFDLSRYIPEGFGTADISIIYSHRFKGIDLKYGKGVKVEAENNSQLKIYAIGAAVEFDEQFDFDFFEMTIYQPRLENIDTMEISRDELLDWAQFTLVPRAKLAWEGKGEFVTGDHCKFCKALAVCPAAKEKAMTITRYKFAANSYLPDEAVVEAYLLNDLVAAYLKETKRYALDEAVHNGKKWPGLKLVNGRSNRRYTSEEKVAKRLRAEGYSDDDFYNKSIKGIGEMVNLLGGDFDKVLKGLVEKPIGAPTLVPEGDKREKYSKVKGKFSNIS